MVEKSEETFVLVIEQFLHGQWVELIQIKAEYGIEDGEVIETDLSVDADDSEVQSRLEELTKIIFNSDKVHIMVEMESCVFERSDGPIRIKAISSEELPY